MTEQKPLFDQFDLIAQSYDSIKFVRAPAQKSVEVANIAQGESVLDIACGTGWITIPAAQAAGSAGRVCAIDIARPMIAVAEAKAAAANVHNIEFSVMNGQSPEFGDEQFDVILCGMALFAFPDVGQALENWQRCLKKGGRVVFSSWGERFLSRFNELLSARLAEVSDHVAFENVIGKLDSVDKCRTYLEETQYSDISVSLFDMSYFHPDVASYWQEMNATVQGIKLHTLTSEQKQIVLERHFEDIGQLMTREGIRFDAPVIISSARRPV